MHERSLISIVDASGLRQCGDCTVCCHVLEIDDPELNKPAGIPCSHCANGCRVYERRPRVCRDWLCMWREFPGLLDDSWRPDHCGVLMRMAEVDASGMEAPYFEVLDASQIDWTGLAAVVAPYLRAGDNVHFGVAARDGMPGRGLPLRLGLSPQADLPAIRAGLLAALAALRARSG